MSQPRSVAQRQGVDFAVKVLSSAAAIVGLVFLASILYTVLWRGVGAFGLAFFTMKTAPPLEGGGMGNAILGSMLITALATLTGVPLGVMAGVFLAEFARHNRWGTYVRFACDVLMGTPSILVGVFVYTLLVVPMKQFSASAGAAALAIIMLPIIARTTDDMLRLVPDALRESALALGAPRWKTTLDIVFRAAKGGLLTGIILAVARVSGETAPLLFTALNNSAWPTGLGGPTANLTVTIYNRAMSPFPDWQQMAWGASLLITAAVLCLNIVARYFLQPRH
ncbi:MAG: phosphate ABC transporter permease PstA [Pirellulales bacterium]|nr:phosphate ABC transporter permease PstA [Pirellulales bacterium]